MDIICSTCRRYLRCAKVGIRVAVTQYGPVYSGDSYKCPGCGITIVTDLGREPVSHDQESVDKADLVLS